MDIELEKNIDEAIAKLRSLASESFDYQLMDPIAQMMLIALLNETQKIRDYIDRLDQKLLDRFCEDFIPRQQTSAMPALALVAPKFKKGKVSELATVGSGVSFTYKNNANKLNLNYLPLFKNTLIPYDDIYVLSNNKLTFNDHTYPVVMTNPNIIWIGIHTQAEIDSLEGFSICLQNVIPMCPTRISAVTNENKELDFCTMERLEDLEMLEPFDAQQTSQTFLSIVDYWKDLLTDMDDCMLLYITDKTNDRDVFKKRAYPRVFQNWLESEVLDCFQEDTLWLQLEFPEGSSVKEGRNIIPNVLPVVNVDVDNVTLTQVAPIAKLQKQEDAYFLMTLETSVNSQKQGFSLNSEEFVIRDFDACCYHEGDLYRDIRNLYNHFVEDYYAFINYNGLKDGKDIKRLKELVNKIGKSVGNQSAKYKFDSGTYAMKNINQTNSSSVTKVFYLTTQGKLGNFHIVNNGNDTSSKFECKKLPLMESTVPIVVSARGGKDKATADQRYELIRYFTLTNDRLYTKMDVDAFVRKELVAMFGKDELKRIYVKVHVEGTGGVASLERCVYVDLDFKDKKNYIKAENEQLEHSLYHSIVNHACISMPIIVRLKSLE
jgi:hypothetical protein